MQQLTPMVKCQNSGKIEYNIFVTKLALGTCSMAHSMVQWGNCDSDLHISLFHHIIGKKAIVKLSVLRVPDFCGN